MQDCCLRLQLAGKRKSTQLLCLSAIVLLVIVNSALYSRSLLQMEQVEKLKKELMKPPPSKRTVDPQNNLQASFSSPSAVTLKAAPLPVAPNQVVQPVALQLKPSDAPDMIALDRALIDALSSMSSACASTTTCYPHCDTPAAPAQSRIDAAARFQLVHRPHWHSLTPMSPRIPSAVLDDHFVPPISALHHTSMHLMYVQAAKAYQQGILNGGKHPAPSSPLPVPRFASQPGSVKCYSQTDEDGILLLASACSRLPPMTDVAPRYIFAKIGTTTRRAVEICSGDGYENNVANLAVLHGWEVIMMDGRENNMAHARRFYSQPGMPSSMKMPHLIRDFITRANVNKLISDKGFSGEIDLFSLDMDGVDWCNPHALLCASLHV